MEPSTWIAVGALGLALLTFVATQFGSRRTATASYVSSLERRIELQDERIAILEAENRSLRNENIALMRRIVKAENGNGH